LITLEAPDEACHGVGPDAPEAPDSSYGLILLEEVEVCPDIKGQDIVI
jgi:hypothetical protein